MQARSSGCSAAYAVLSNLSPVYKASSRIAFERTLSRYLQSNKITNEPLIEDADTLGQIYVISSESIVLPVVKALSLTSDPEFVGGQGTESLGSRIRGLFRTAAHAVGLQEETTPGGTVPGDPREGGGGRDAAQFVSHARRRGECHQRCIFVERPG